MSPTGRGAVPGCRPVPRWLLGSESASTAEAPPADIRIDFVSGNARGWSAVFTHPLVDRVCGLAYGFDSPPGWSPGAVLCGPITAPTSPGAAAPPSGR